MPGLGEASMFSPLAILKRAVGGGGVGQSVEKRLSSTLVFRLCVAEVQEGIHTIELQQLLVGGLSSKLLGVLDGGVEVGHVGWLVGVCCCLGNVVTWCECVWCVCVVRRESVLRMNCNNM